jgi:copper chaperone CopZ
MKSNSESYKQLLDGGTVMKKTAIIAFAALAVIALMFSAETATACGGSSKGVKMGDAGKAKATMASSTVEGKVETVESKIAGKACSMDKAIKSASDDSDAGMVTLAVKGMTCGGCEGQLKQALSVQKGVEEVVQVCHKSDIAVLKYDPKVVEPSELVSVVNKAGYEAEVKPAGDEMSGDEMKKVSKEKSIEM